MPTGCWAKMLHLSGQYSISSPCFRAVQIFMQANESKPNQSNTVHSNHKPVVAIQTNSAIPFPTIPFHCIQLQIPLGDAIYTDGKGERTSFRQSVEVGVGDGRRNVASISLGKLNHKMLLTHRHTSTAHRAHRYTEKKNA